MDRRCFACDDENSCMLTSETLLSTEDSVTGPLPALGIQICGILGLSHSELARNLVSVSFFVVLVLI